MWKVGWYVLYPCGNPITHLSRLDKWGRLHPISQWTLQLGLARSCTTLLSSTVNISSKNLSLNYTDFTSKRVTFIPTGNVVLWVMKPCNSVGGYQQFRGIFCIGYQTTRCETTAWFFTCLEFVFRYDPLKLGPQCLWLWVNKHEHSTLLLWALGNAWLASLNVSVSHLDTAYFDLGSHCFDIFHTENSKIR